MAAEFIEYGLSTTTALAFVTKLLTTVFRVSTLQLATAATSADMLSFEIFARSTWCRIKWSPLATVGLTFSSFALSCATTLTTFVSSTIQRDSTNAHALRRLLGTLMADCL